MSELNTGLPGVRRIQRSIQSKETVEVKLITNDVFSGVIRWQDPDWLCILDAQNQEILVGRSAVVYFRPVS